MRSPLACLALLGVLAGCAGTTDGGSDLDAGPTPALGGHHPAKVDYPDDPMSPMEQHIAEVLSPDVADEDLTLDYLECPSWDKKLPSIITCEGFVSGVVGHVEVRLTGKDHGPVDFKATLTDGVIATHTLVQRLEGGGYQDVDCGETPAYPAQVGIELVCSVAKDGGRHYVVATVSHSRGAVMVEDY